MNYREIKAEPALRPFVNYFWTLEKTGTALPWEGVKLLPDGHLELTVNFGDPVAQRRSGAAQTRPQAFIGGMYNSAFFIEPQGSLEMIGAAFLPGKLQHFVKFPIADLCGALVDMDDIFGNQWKPILARMQEQKSLENRVLLLQQFLLSVLNPEKGLRFPIEQALSLLYKSAGSMPMQQLWKQLHLSEYNFRRLFREATGMNPKQFSSILRVKNAVTAFETGQFPTLTDLSYHFGYFDQAHFIHDFRRIAGESPREYFSNRRAGDIRF